jgi:hypothetical protein
MSGYRFGQNCCGCDRCLMPVRLSQDSGCVYGLVWRVQIEPPYGGAALCSVLATHGWRTCFELGDLLALVNSGGHQVLLLRRTERVQIRLNYVTPRQQRHSAAYEVFEELIHAANLLMSKQDLSSISSGLTAIPNTGTADIGSL